MSLYQLRGTPHFYGLMGAAGECIGREETMPAAGIMDESATAEEHYAFVERLAALLCLALLDRHTVDCKRAVPLLPNTA
ncbi:MAG: hypothetical protein ACRDS1_06780 [Pseudonocardiaceae bacterium]